MTALRGILAKTAASLAIIAATVCAATAQQQPAAAPPATPAPAPATTPAPIDPKAHEAAVRLFDALGMKDKMNVGLDSMMANGIQAMKSQFPTVKQEFLDEWSKRMKARFNADDFVAIAVNVYAKYFTAGELDELTKAAQDTKEGQTPVLSDALKEKFQNNATSIQSEVIGGTTQLGAKPGGDVGAEIAKEHPDWAPQLAPAPAPATKP